MVIDFRMEQELKVLEQIANEKGLNPEPIKELVRKAKSVDDRNLPRAQRRKELEQAIAICIDKLGGSDFVSGRMEKQ